MKKKKKKNYINGYQLLTVQYKDEGTVDEMFLSYVFESKVMLNKHLDKTKKEKRDGIIPVDFKILRIRFYPKKG